MQKAAYLLLLSTIAGSAGCAPAREGIEPRVRCDVRSLEQVFSDPLAYDGQRFCGAAIAFAEGRSLKLFPVGHDLVERNDIVAFPGERIETALRRGNPTRPFEIYVEGRIRPMRDCFLRPVQADGTWTCVPFRRPIDIEVEHYRIVAGHFRDRPEAGGAEGTGQTPTTTARPP